MKSAGHVTFIFLSRISPKKNLYGILKMLGYLSGNIHFTIVGPVRDEDYWRKCLDAIEQLPENVFVHVSGSVPHEKVHTLLSQHHFFILPTLGENFGHAILEAMAAGTPVIISDQTPWRNLKNQSAGWDIALEGQVSDITLYGQAKEFANSVNAGDVNVKHSQDDGNAPQQGNDIPF